jgi:signal transduction histidine kinase
MKLRHRLIVVVVIAALGISVLGGGLLLSTRQRTRDFVKLTTALDAEQLRAGVDVCIGELHRQLTLMGPFLMAETEGGGLDATTRSDLLQKLDDCEQSIDDLAATRLTGDEVALATAASELLETWRSVVAALSDGDHSRAARRLALDADPLAWRLLTIELVDAKDAYKAQVDRYRWEFLVAARAGDGLLGIVAGLAVLGTLLLIAMLVSIERGIHGLLAGTTAYKSGDLTHVTARSGVPDLDRVSEQMNEMATSIVLASTELEDRAQRLQSTIETLRQTQDQLVEQEKMAALGNLVAGVAHEVNTPLGVAITAASFAEEQLVGAQRELAGESPSMGVIAAQMSLANEAFELLSSNLARAAQLVRSFKQVAVDRSQVDTRSLDLEQWLGAVVKSLSPLARRHQVEVGYRGPEGSVVQLSAGQLEQVLTNLIVNAFVHAFQAVPERAEDGPACRVQVDLEDRGEHLEMRIRDNGKGMTMDTADRVFEPFFTTGRGQNRTGLGLHIVHQVITAAFEGQITLDTKVGRGTTWCLILPFGTEGLKRLS